MKFILIGNLPFKNSRFLRNLGYITSSVIYFQLICGQVISKRIHFISFHPFKSLLGSKGTCLWLCLQSLQRHIHASSVWFIPY